MKTKFYILAVLALTIQAVVKGQTQDSRVSGYNESFWNGYIQKLQLSQAEKQEFLAAKKAEALHNSSTPQPTNPLPPIQANSNPLLAGGCNNIDFETGNTQGWTLTSGFHPIFNPLGCCQNAGGQQTIVGGNAVALDPIAGFPVTAPGGNFSLRLGNSATGGQADRIEQTFFVTSANANFTYKYAVVFQDPGHIASEQPAFVVEMFDTLNNAIPCTYYNVSAGQNIPGFQSAANGVVFKPWTNVVVDLTSYIGQNVTIRFTTYDCALGGHFGYAYIDGNCAAFQTTIADTICVGQSKTLCAPPGFGSYLWSGGSVNGQTSQCVTVNTPGNYAVQTTMVTNCQGPTFSYPAFNHPTPNANFNIGNSNNSCNLTVNFNNTSSMSSGSLTTYQWNFGDNTTSSLQNPSHSYSVQGTYTVSLIVGSSKGCYDTTFNVITINPPPAAAFSAPVICLNATGTFTDNSTITPGNINQWQWNFDNGFNTTMQNPSTFFTTAGVHTATLSVTSNQGCVGVGSQTFMVHALPSSNFTANAVCSGQSNSFTNLSTSTSGNITNYIWNFNGFNTSTATQTTYAFPASGIYSVQLTSITNYNCVASITKTVQVYSLPVINFSVANACANTQIQVLNTSSVADGSLTTFFWNFGNNAISTNATPSYAYNTPGNYVVSLIAYSNYNCSSTASQTLSVYALPQVNFTANNACLNQTTQFSNATLIGSGYISKWKWDFENNGSNDDTTSINASHVYPYAGTFICKLTAISNFNCIAHATYPVTVYPNPIADFSANSACLGDKTDFANHTSAPGSAITSYQWQYYGDGNVNNVFPNASHTYSGSGVYLVKLEVQNTFGCTNVRSKSVYVNPKPVVQFAANKIKGCESICVTFTNQSYISNGKIVTYQWQFGDGSMPSYALNPTHCYDAGKYNVTLKVVSDSGCISSYINQSMIEVYPKAIANFNTEPYELDELEPVLNVTNQAQNSDQVTYYINDGSIYTKDNFSHTFTNLDKQKPIVFQVATNKWGCSDTASRIINLKQSYAIYIPNTFTPNDDGLNDGFKASGYNITKFNLKIFDRWGKILFETNDMNEAWDGTTKGSDEPIKNDVYVWKASVVDIHNKAHDLVGHVTLLK